MDLWWALDEKMDLLQRAPLFAGLARKQLGAIAHIADLIDVPAGTALTHEGRHEGYFFVIVSGTVRIEQSGQLINTLGAGDFLGEIALLDGGPRTASATAETACRLLSVTRERFHDLLDTSQSVRAAILEAVGQRMRAIDADAVI